jgi:hypothetical protein
MEGSPKPRGKSETRKTLPTEFEIENGITFFVFKEAKPILDKPKS